MSGCARSRRLGVAARRDRSCLAVAGERRRAPTERPPRRRLEGVSRVLDPRRGAGAPRARGGRRRRSSTGATSAAPRSSPGAAHRSRRRLSRVHGHDRRGDPQGSRPAFARRDARPRSRRSASGSSDPLGFNDSYALAVTRAVARERWAPRGSPISRRIPICGSASPTSSSAAPTAARGSRATTGSRLRDVRGIQHELAYEAIASGKIDVIDIYTTDAQIQHLDLRGARGRPRLLPALRRGVALPARSRATRNPAALAAHGAARRAASTKRR